MEQKRAATKISYPEKTMYRMVQDMADAYPDAVAYEFYNVKTTYRRFSEKIRAAAKAFLHMGIKPGDAVTICMPNVPQALDCFYALDMIGAVANMIHPLSAEQEITFYLNISESRAILTMDMFCEKVEKALAGVDHPVTVLIARMQDELPLILKAPYILKAGRKFLKYPDTDHAKLWSAFLREGRGEAMPQAAEYDAARTSVILYSGGTSGTPKGICLTDRNMNALALECVDALIYSFGVGIRMLSCMPMFHGFGLGINIHTVLIHGATCILMPTFNTKTYAEMLVKKKPNFIAGVPTIFEALLHMPQLDGVSLDYLMGVFCGGDSLTVELKHKVDAFLKEHHSPVEIQEGYGLTECVTASCLTPYGGYREGSIGKPLADMRYAIVKPGTEILLPPDQEGEIILSGPTVMLGYLKNPEETAKTLRRLADGRVWLYTGDLGKMDADGYVYFRQRIKRMIITNGYNVYPGQVENAIDSCPAVAYSCVIGVPDTRRGQRVRAYVVLRDGEKADDAQKEAIMQKLREQVAGYAIPKEIIFRKELPKTLVGKVHYRKLEEEAKSGIA